MLFGSFYYYQCSAYFFQAYCCFPAYGKPCVLVNSAGSSEASCVKNLLQIFSSAICFSLDQSKKFVVWERVKVIHKYMKTFLKRIRCISHYEIFFMLMFLYCYPLRTCVGDIVLVLSIPLVSIHTNFHSVLSGE